MAVRQCSLYACSDIDKRVTEWGADFGSLLKLHSKYSELWNVPKPTESIAGVWQQESGEVKS